MKSISKDILLKIVLISIAIGIWVQVLQNAGIFPTDIRVKVINEVEAYVRGIVDIDNTVSIDGSVDVDNTVSVSIDEVLGSDGKKYYFNNY